MGRIVATLVIYIAYSHVADAKTVTLPLPTGGYSVGRRLVRWMDTARPEVFSSRPDEKRQLTVWLWYPAASAAGLPAATYVEQIEKLANSLPKDAVRLSRSTTTHATANAPVAATPSQFPVILFSPGLGTIPAFYSSLCEDLASRGYVVAAVDHPYDDLAVLLSDGRVVRQAKQPSEGEELLRFQRERVAVRAEDLRFVLDQLTRAQDERIADPLRGRLDLSHVGAFGHSVGGMTAAEMCKNGARVLACANMNGVVRALPLYAEDAPNGLERPFLFLEKPLPSMKAKSPIKQSVASRVYGSAGTLSWPEFGQARAIV